MATTFGLGDLTIHRVIEQEQPFFDPFEFLPSLTREQLDANRSWLEPSALDPATGKLILCIQSYIVRTPHHTILIDSCVGNDKTHPQRPFWHMKTDDTYMRSLAAHGLSVDDIDFVMCTHLHPDHVGWNTRKENGRWVPTFPKARYLFSRNEYEHWNARHAETPIPYMVDSVLPIVEAGRADLVQSDHAFDEHVRLEPTPGHTSDHFAVHVSCAGHDAVMTGDLIHSPIQARYPEISARPDVDPLQAARTRRAFLDRYCETGTLVCTAHFPSPSAGHIRRWDDAFRFEPAG